MNTPFDHIKGHITVNGRIYSAKEVIRGLLEQGISITESTEGMKIGFKQLTPLTSSSHDFTQGNEISECPFLPYMNKVALYLENITSRLESNEFQPSSQFKSQMDFTQSGKANSSAFSPFDTSSFQSETKTNQEKEKFFSSGGSFLDKHHKCSTCGAIIPQNAFFCNKCGNHVRSG
ncbi:MAG: hypothetical protein ACFFAU_05530 [Candidatus Hodarchaeota archaeon]